MPPFIQNIDFYLSQTLRSMHTPAVDVVANALTDVTYGGLLWWVLAIVLWMRNHKLLAIEIIFALIIAVIEVSVFKHIFHRARPTVLTLTEHFRHLQMLTADSYSFPSGHTLLAFAATGVIQINFPDWRGKAALATAVAIGIARVYEGWHWPTDVLAGMILGLITAYLSMPVASKVYAKGEHARRALAEKAQSAQKD